MRRTSFLLVSTLALWLPAGVQAEVIVNDPAAIAKMMTQLQNLKAQLDTQKQQLTNMSGITGMGNIAGQVSSELSKVPRDWSQVYQQGSQWAIEGKNYLVNMDSKREAMQQENPTQAVEDAHTTARQNQATSQQTIQSLYDNNQKELEQINELQGGIATAKSDKEIQDLQAKISTTQAAFQAGQARLSAMTNLQNAQYKIDQEQLEQAQHYATWGERGKFAPVQDPGLPPALR